MSYTTHRHFPVRPDLLQLKHQAKDLLKAYRQDEPEAQELFLQLHPQPIQSRLPKLAEAQLVLARSYGLPSWARLVTACQITDAIWQNDASIVKQLVLKDPKLLVEDARGVSGNWGPPMSYAANVGRTEIVEMLGSLGATDVQHAYERACLQGRLDTARRLFEMGARPAPGSVMGPCETLNADGLALQIELGAPLTDGQGDALAPVAMILQTYSRNPEGKHRCLEIIERAGTKLLDTAPMAVHRGRLDLLKDHLALDPGLFTRQFSLRQLFPRSMGCSEDVELSLHGTPLEGATLLHMCVDYDEFELATWMLDQGAPVDAKAAIDNDGFGGHTPLFGTVVSQPYLAGRSGHERFTRLLLSRGANVNARASLRKALKFARDESLHEYRNVNPQQWGEQFHDQDWVNPAALKLVSRE